MRDPCAFLRSSLSESGLEPTRISRERQYGTHSDTIIVSKKMGNEMLNYQVDISDYEMMIEDGESAEKIMAMRAEKIVNAFENHMVDKIRLGQRAVKVCPYSGGWAECQTCGERVELPSVDQKVGFEKEAELCTPMPTPRDTSQFTENLDSVSRLALKVYLMGMLREKCSHDCPNSKWFTGEMFVGASD